MKTYFIVSDIHSFYTPLKQSLDTAGFDINNKSHVLVVAGDVFDRGPETVEVYQFLKSIPSTRLILIRGNHEELFFNLLNKPYPQSHDFSNGTVLTCTHIAGYEPRTAYVLEHGYHYYCGTYWDREEIDPECQDLWRDIKKKVKESEIYRWLKSKKWKNFYEIDNYIITHSFIPLYYTCEDISEDYAIYYGLTKCFDYYPTWREANDVEWAKAAWGCPYKFIDAGLFNEEAKEGKVLVCGHFKSSAFNEHYLNMFNNHDIYYGKKVIAIDATTALSRQVNVLVIENGKCYDQSGNLLQELKPFPIIETVPVDEKAE